MSKPGIIEYGYDRIFLMEARECVYRCQRAVEEGDAELEIGAAASAIGAACMAAEAFLSERLNYHRHEGTVSASDIERVTSDETLFRMLNRLTKCFSGENLASHSHWDRFCAVVRLRGCLFHRTARYLHNSEWPQALKGDEALIPHEDRGRDWAERVLREETARWAVTVVGKILQAAHERIPPPPEGTVVRTPPIEITLDVASPDSGSEESKS